MVVSTLRLFPSPGQRRHTLSVLRSVQGPTQVMSHCLSCRLFEEDGYDEGILYMEQWDSVEALNLHIRSDLYNRILAATELSRTPPEFCFHFVDSTRQLDLIEAVRVPGIKGRTNPDNP